MRLVGVAATSVTVGATREVPDLVKSLGRGLLNQVPFTPLLPGHEIGNIGGIWAIMVLLACDMPPGRWLLDTRNMAQMALNGLNGAILVI